MGPRRTHSLSARALPLLALLLAGTASAAGAADRLEQKLREQRTDVIRWQTRPLGAPSASPPGEQDIAAVGRLGPRTPVRYADGHTRWFRVAGFRPVYVVARPIEGGTHLSAQDASSAERDVIALACEPVESLDTATRWRATRRLAVGAALCVGDVEIPPPVERDRPVTLTTQRGAVSASRVLTATTDAHAGEVVRLRDPVSGATVTAIVTGSHAARIPEEHE